MRAHDVIAALPADFGWFQREQDHARPTTGRLEVQKGLDENGGRMLSAGGAAGLRLPWMQRGTETDLEDGAGSLVCAVIRHRLRTLHCPA